MGADTGGLEGCLIQPQCASFSWGWLRFLTVLYCAGITERRSGSRGTSVIPYDSPMIRLGVHADTHLGVFMQDNLFTLSLPWDGPCTRIFWTSLLPGCVSSTIHWRAGVQSKCTKACVGDPEIKTGCAFGGCVYVLDCNLYYFFVREGDLETQESKRVGPSTVFEL